MSEVWAKWQGQVINGVFPLRSLLGESDHSGVFLTEFKARNLPNAALKLVPAHPTLADTQLSHWSAAAALSHPHLIQQLEMGRCQRDGRQFLFVVMEYAEQSLAQIIPQRALTPDEVREMLSPTLAALSFLHGKQLVQGSLKPQNILAVGDRLKLASDTILPGVGSVATAADIWSLGTTVIEALTQQPPVYADGLFNTASLPATFPAMFTGFVQQCLNRNPADRPTATALQGLLDPAPVPQPLAPLEAASPREWPKQRLIVAALAVVLVVLLAVWAGSRGHRMSQDPQTSGSAPVDAAAPSSATTADSHPAASRPISGASNQPVRTPANESASVLHEEIPDVPRSARETIRGRIKVAVRVTVDASGNVTHATVENPGANKYFARLATDAAGKWKFAPADDQDSRKWLLRFEFTRGGAIGRASSSSSGD
jgi:TonB family protein